MADRGGSGRSGPAQASTVRVAGGSGSSRARRPAACPARPGRPPDRAAATAGRPSSLDLDRTQPETAPVVRQRHVGPGPGVRPAHVLGLDGRHQVLRGWPAAATGARPARPPATRAAETRSTPHSPPGSPARPDRAAAPGGTSGARARRARRTARPPAPGPWSSRGSCSSSAPRASSPLSRTVRAFGCPAASTVASTIAAGSATRSSASAAAYHSASTVSGAAGRSAPRPGASYTSPVGGVDDEVAHAVRPVRRRSRGRAASAWRPGAGAARRTARATPRRRPGRRRSGSPEPRSPRGSWSSPGSRRRPRA